MKDVAELFVQFMGTERVGKGVITITEVKLNNVYFTGVPDELIHCTIPENNKGHIQEISAAAFKLHFIFNDKYGHSIQQATFWVRKAYFDRFFK